MAAAQLGAARRAETIESGSGALERLRGPLGAEAVVVLTRAELVEAAA